VRCFEDDNVVHVDGNVDPARDKDIIDTELILKDIDTLEKRVDKHKKAAKGGDKAEMQKVEICNSLMEHLSDSKPARSFDQEDEAVAELIKDMYLLTNKPILYVCNVDENSVVKGNVHTEAFEKVIEGENAELLLISAAIEAEIAELDDLDERMEFVKEMGLSEPGVNRVIQSCYKLLNLQTYFTAGEKEVRAWTVKVGTKAPGAAGVIHTDFETGFIRAEVIAYDDYVSLGSEAAVKDAGKMKVEGKEYVVQDGDVMHFRFNV